jgi:7,8-dihydroneopterin aldolase/epimerase/oxygenase
MDKLFISGLQVETIIGVYPNERVEKQSLKMDIEITLDIQAAINSDQIQQTVDYAILIEKITQWTSTTTFQLVESLADFLAKKILSTFPVQSVGLRLHKFSEKVRADSVGVVIERKKLV